MSITFEIKKHMAVLSEDGKWPLEVNLVSWNGKPAKFDIRMWSPDHEKCSKGITLTKEEFEKLKSIEA